MKIPAYLVRNEFGKYHFRILLRTENYPKTSKNVFKRSLQTTDRKLAVTMARGVKSKIDRLWQVLAVTNMDWLETKDLLNKIVDETLQEYRASILELGTYGDHVTDYPMAALEQMAEDFLEKKSNNDQEFSIEGYPLLKEYIDGAILKYGLDNDPQKYNRNLIQIVEMLVKTKIRRSQLLKSFYRSIPEFYEKAKNQFKVNDTVSTIEFLVGDSLTVHDETSKYKHKRHYLFELAKEYEEYKISKNLWKSPKTIELNKLKIQYLVNFLDTIKISKTQYIDDFTRQDAVNFESSFQKLPANLTKIVHTSDDIKKTISKILSGELKVSGKNISPLTYNGYCDLLTGMFSWATQPKQGYIKNHPFIDIKIKNVKSNRRESFTSKDIELFFSTDLFTQKKFDISQSWRYFVPIIMAYTGMRLEEVCQLQISNILKIDDIYCFNIVEEVDQGTGIILTKLKNTESSQRIVPIHKILRKVGLFRYIAKLEKEDHQRLFPSLVNTSNTGNYKKAGAKVSKWFNEDDKKNGKKSYLTKSGVNAEGNTRKVLYVFRHTVETLLINHKNNIEHDKIDMLLGHKVKSIGRANYGRYNARTLADVINFIEYPSSNLPWDTNKDYARLKFSWE